MAKVTGSSGAWRDLVRPFRGLGLGMENPSQLRATLDRLERGRPETETSLAAQVDLEIEELERELLAVEQSFREKIKTREWMTSRAIAPMESRLAQLRGERGVLRRLWNWFVARGVAAEMDRTKARYQLEIAELQRGADEQKNRATRLRQGRDAVLDGRRKAMEAGIAGLRVALRSRELAGAEAELQVVEELARLPDEYHVFHDVRLEARKFMRFEGTPLQTAQIDHVVLAPFGVFVVETKNWSRSFTESGEGFDPYTQVARAQRLCVHHLEGVGGHPNLRGIIVTLGDLPANDRNRFIKSLRPAELVRYIRIFESRDAKLRPECHQNIAERLARSTSPV